ncbi:hypothetical protein [Microbacterium sp. Bi128]|uniref:hypothetical protein n=1 Tax=Microbacterium sp. Bi128 TaxID=2821115 RepID=UPI001DB0304D|nr:hypothetical protein [Microbacterium sp. Bi128]CAH0166892.1 hypothetical protein SRABI128_00934 [Microbacterium sp. Bi128]
MTTPTRRVRNADVTPDVRCDLFRAHPDRRFAVIALGHGLRANPLYTAYLELRTRVYTEQTGMLDPDSLTYGLDVDDDDDRSASFLVVENRSPFPVAVACVRVIERLGADNRPLPADSLYGLALGSGSVEVSRYIGRLDDSRHQARALSELLRSTIAHIRQAGADGDVYAIVERPLERLLRIMGVGVVRIADPIWLDEYQGVNVAIRLDPVVSAVGLGGLSEIDELDVSEGAARFWGTVER